MAHILLLFLFKKQNWGVLHKKMGVNHASGLVKQAQTFSSIFFFKNHHVCKEKRGIKKSKNTGRQQLR